MRGANLRRSLQSLKTHYVYALSQMFLWGDYGLWLDES